MKTYLFLLAIIVSAQASYSQVPYNLAAPNGYTKKASVAEQVGRTWVSITYHRPAVNGRDGKIWGGVVHAGFITQGFGSGRPAPWRAGANENTVIEFDNEVKVEGQILPRGKYGLFVAYHPTESIVIFSKKTAAWGSFFYDEKDDALRVKVKPRPLETSVEHLKYEFSNQTLNSAVIVLSWEKLAIPFKVEVDHLKQQFEAFVAESQQPGGFTWQGLSIAANWTLQQNYQLEKGLEWASLASSKDFPGNPASFAAVSVKARLLEALGRSEEAAVALKAALPLGNLNELQQFGRQLLAAKQPKTALEVFQFNYNKHPDQFITLLWMARGLSANAEYTKALEYANKALPLAPNESAKQAVKEMIEKLKAGKDIN